MKLRYLLPLLCLLATFTGKTLANNCYFTITQANIPDFWTSSVLLTPIGTNTITPIIDPYIISDRFPIFQTGVQPTHCDDGGNDNSVTLTAPDASMMDTGYTVSGENGKPAGVLKTSIPGIVYTYFVACVNNCHRDNSSDMYLDLPTSPGASNSFSTQSGAPWAYSGNLSYNWEIIVTVYQTPEYRPHNGQTTGHIKGGLIGTLHMGNSGKNDVPLYISDASFQFTVQEPTCAAMGINNDEYDRLVDFGDFYASDIEKTGGSVEVPFTLSMFRCMANRIGITLSGTHTDNTTLSNTIGSAEGIGVKIRSTINGNTRDMLVDGTTPVGIDFSGTDWHQEQVHFDFTGQLVKNGTIKPGSFETVATFTITYE